MNKIMEIVFGSKLYGTDSELSDTDIKGIYLPSIDECILGTAKKSVSDSTGDDFSKNSAEDCDYESYSLQYFLQLASKGEMIVIDCIHSEASIKTSPEWEYIRANRKDFYTKNLKGYIGYVRKQVAKYGFKGTRLAVLENVMQVVRNVTKDSSQKLGTIWSDLPEGEFIIKGKEPIGTGGRMYEICGKKMSETSSISYFYDMVSTYYDSFGERAKKAKENKGVDWKAVSHAFRACDQLIEIYETGDLKYPLKNAQFIKDVKYGKYHFVNDNLGDLLEEKLAKVEKLAKESDYPDEFDIEKWNKWLVSLYTRTDQITNNLGETYDY